MNCWVINFMDKILTLTKKQIPLEKLCMDCMRNEADYLCDMPHTPTFIHYNNKGTRQMKISTSCDRLLCKKCAIEIAPNIHICNKCADTIRDVRLRKRKML